MSTWTKSAARMPRAWTVRKCFQVGPLRRGAGLTPAACRICHTVDEAIGWPSLTSSPCTRRRPHVGFSVAMRITSLRIAAAVDGRPGRRRFVQSICVRPAAGARPAESPGSPRTPHPIAAWGSAGTAPKATAGRPAGSGPGRSGGAAPCSRGAPPGVQHPWTPHAGPAPSDSRAGSARAGRRPRRSLSDDANPAGRPGQIQ